MPTAPARPAPTMAVGSDAPPVEEEEEPPAAAWLVVWLPPEVWATWCVWCVVRCVVLTTVCLPVVRVCVPFRIMLELSVPGTPVP